MGCGRGQGRPDSHLHDVQFFQMICGDCCKDVVVLGQSEVRFLMSLVLMCAGEQ